MDYIAGLSADTIAIDQGIGSVSGNGSFTVSPYVTTTYAITATGLGGTTKATVTINVMPHVSISIANPAAGASISRPDILVEGVISNPSGSQIGIAVNGVAAVLYEDHFAANHVPLVEGQNTITVIATGMEGNMGEESIVVFAETPGDYVTLKPVLAAGLSPFETMLIVNGSGSFSQKPSIAASGPGEVVITAGESLERMSATMQAEGIYHLTATAADALGNIYDDTIALAVLSGNKMDALFRSQWSGMLLHLNNGNSEGALSYFTDVSRSKYGRLFNLLQGRLPTVASKLTDIEMVYLQERIAQYRLKKDEDVQGQTRTISHCIYFVKDGSGLWKISEF